MAAKRSRSKTTRRTRRTTKKTTARRTTTRRSPAKTPQATTAKKTPTRSVLGPATVVVVNMIPRTLSGEQSQDSEPHLAVNPSNPKQIVGTAFTGDPSGGPHAPIYVSSDGGNTWALNSIVPSTTGASSGTFDITTAFSGKGSTLYAGILKAGNGHLEFLRTIDPFTPTVMTVLKDRANADQPFTHATVEKTGKTLGKERVYIGNNDFAGPGGKTATVDEALNAGATTASFTTVRVEKRTTSGQDGPQSRPVAHPDGTVYSAFYRWRAGTGNFQANTFKITSADVVVVRDDKGGSGSPPFSALIDTDGTAGKRVVQGVSFAFMVAGTAATGQQRLGGSLSIAVDPRDSKRVFLAWGDAQPGSILTLHVRLSTDSGQTWSAADCLTLPNSTNAALAVNASGVVGLLYQELRGTGAAQRWVTHLRRSNDAVNWNDLILADTPAATPVKSFDPYLGDYDHLLSLGNDFYGVFCANNTPDKTHFPNGVKYQRVADFNSRKLFRVDGTTVVAPSIDPFFFKVS